jgi:hypothetical protein
VEHNELLVDAALTLINKSVTGTPTAKNIDDLFQSDSGKKAKGEFAFELAAMVDANADTAHVPEQLVELFDWLWAGHVAAGTDVEEEKEEDTGNGSGEDGTNGQG